MGQAHSRDRTQTLRDDLTRLNRATQHRISRLERCEACRSPDLSHF
jgi:hypothetical protein